MRVGIDARLVGRGLGIARFITNLVANLGDGVEVVWFGNPAFAPVSVRAVRADLAPYPALDLNAARHVARRVGVDVMHFTANTGWSRPGSPPFVLTVHDMLFMDTPVAGRALRQVVGHRYVRRSVLRALAAADVTATPSAASAAEIAARARVAPPVVVPNGVDVPTTRGVPADRSRYAVAFSARDPRKGTELAVAGWRAAGLPEQLWLLAGAGMQDGLEQDIAEDVSRGRIVVLPYLERSRLHEILSGAVALIYPSRAEGFGLPVLEAMGAGVPVITGLAPATLEVGGDAIIAIDPAEPAASIAAGLQLIAREPSAIRRLVMAGRRRAERYSWAASAAAYLKLYETAARSK